MARRIESHFLEGSAGKLEALLEEPENQSPREVALVCHPHPLYGGTMHNKVVYRIARGLRRSGSVVLRFNFRGVGRSEGEYAHGVGEMEDAKTALRWLRERYPHLPYTLAGFSFGSRIILRLGCDGSTGQSVLPSRLIAAGFPTRGMESNGLESCRIPKVLIQSTNDEYGPREELEAIYAELPAPKQLRWVEAKNHFFSGSLDKLEEIVLLLT